MRSEVYRGSRMGGTGGGLVLGEAPAASTRDCLMGIVPSLEQQPQ